MLAFGTERHGLSDELPARAQQLIRIPMRDGVSSLNLATAVAAVLFSWRTASAGRGRSVTAGAESPSHGPVELLVAAAVVLLAFWATLVLVLARSGRPPATVELRRARRVARRAHSTIALRVVDHAAVVEHQRRHQAVAGQLLDLRRPLVWLKTPGSTPSP